MRPKVELHLGDCLDVLRTIEDGSVDAVVTDPPAGIHFMSAAWDHHKGGRAEWVAWLSSVMAECLRVARPGSYLLCWALPRTSHWTATAIEDAGWEIRDVVTALNGQGFPKNHNVSKALSDQDLRCNCSQKSVQYPSPIREGKNSADAESYHHVEDVRGLRSGMDAAEPGTVPAKPRVLAEVQCGPHQSAENGKIQDSPGDLYLLRGRVPAEVERLDQPGEVLLGGVQRPASGERSGRGSTAPGDCHDGACRLDGSQPGELLPQDDRGEQSRMEGRGDVQAEQGQLRRAEVCPMPGRPDVNGQGRRLRDGAPAGDGPDGRPVPRSRRGRPSSRPQHAEQRPDDPGTVAEQRGAQAGRAWPACDRCGKPIIPDGLGTALKPAAEFWILARKPIIGTVAENVLRYGTGALNIDACRIAGQWTTWQVQKGQPVPASVPGNVYGNGAGLPSHIAEQHPAGRWPAHLVLSHTPDCERAGTMRVKGTAPMGDPSRGGRRINRDQYRIATGTQTYADPDGLETVAAWRCSVDCPVAELDRQSGQRTSGLMKPGQPRRATLGKGGYNQGFGEPASLQGSYGDTGGASRFFYTPKASRSDRGDGNTHPTVKSTELMRWLLRLIATPGDVVLDPFMGSGSTGKAAVIEGMGFTGIERSPEYLAVAERRIAAERDRLALIEPEPAPEPAAS